MDLYRADRDSDWTIERVQADTFSTEAFVIQGSLQGVTDELPERGWLRLPPGSTAVWHAGAQGATVLLKSTAPHTATT